MFGRKDSRTHTDQLLDELAQSYGHLKLAAGHAAGGAAEKLTPPYDKTRNAASRGWTSTRGAFAPMYEQMRDGAANARKRMPNVSDEKTRWPVLAGLLAAGAAVGAAGAMIAKRRRATREWGEFEPDQMLDEPGYGLESTGTQPGETDAARDKVSSAAHTAGKKVTAGAAAVASGVSSQAGKLADALGDKSTRASSEETSDLAGKAADAAAEVGDKAGDMAEKASDKKAELSEKATHSANERKQP